MQPHDQVVLGRNLLITPPSTNMSVLPYPSTATAQFELDNQTGQEITLTDIQGSCGCERFAVNNGTLAPTLRNPGSAVAVPSGTKMLISADFKIAPGPNRIAIRLTAKTRNEEYHIGTSIVYHGQGALSLSPPEHNLGNDVTNGHTYPFETLVSSNTAQPFNLYSTDDQVELNPNENLTAWTVRGSFAPTNEGQVGISHTLKTDIPDLPEITIDVFGIAPRRIEIPRVISYTWSEDLPDPNRRITIIRNDPNIDIREIKLIPEIEGIHLSFDEKFIHISGKPRRNPQEQDTMLEVSFTGDYPTKLVRFLIVHT